MAPLLVSYDDALDYCLAQRMRLSKQRRLILKFLWATNEHLLARDIYHRLHQQGQEIGYTSVYQTLDALSRVGVIERVERANGCLYSRLTQSRFHVHCLDDNRVFDVMVALPTHLIATIEAQVGFKIYDYHIELFVHQVEKR
jgi:Fur family transcriptional regulator, ferric uptake regulator